MRPVTTAVSPAARSGGRAVRSSLGPWVIAGIVGWAGVAWIAVALWHNDPPKAGFDLALLLEGARRILAGQSPYDPAMLTGTARDAVELFYSYPPPVAQALTALSWLTDGVVLVLWAIGAAAGFGFVAARLAARDGRDPWRMAVRAVAILPFVLPFAIAVLFGNLDAWYPLAYGLLLLSAMPGCARGTRIAAGIAIAIVSVAKLNPAPLLLWVGLRVIRDRGGPQRRVLATALVTILVILAASVAVGGVQPWRDYVEVLRAGANADLVDARNIAPVSLIAQATGIDGAALRWIQVAIVAGVIALTAVAALRVSDPVLSVALVSAATLVTLPVTWYHYPVALLPIGAALAIGHPATRPRLVLAIALADVAIVWLPLVWVAVAVLLVAAWEASRRVTRDAHAGPPLPAGSAA